MGFNIGIIGLPNVGKSTLFNTLSNARAQVSNYAFTTIDPNIGIAEVPDERIDNLAKLCSSKKKIYTTIEFVDIAGLVKGASKGEGLGNQFLANIREVDAIVHVVRCFNDENITHVEGSINPKRDIEIINSELLLADLSTVEKRIESLSKTSKSGDKNSAKEIVLLEKIKNEIEKGVMIYSLPLKDEERQMLKGYNLLSSKPVLFAANIGEEDIVKGNTYLSSLQDTATEQNSKVVTFCAKLEAELKDLPPEEAEEFLKEAGIKETGLSKVIKAGYETLDLITFFTASEKEARAWTVKMGSKAPVAAGKIHSDFEKGFIAAEVVKYEGLILSGSYQEAKEKGLIRIEGREYEIKDGDIVVFRFNK